MSNYGSHTDGKTQRVFEERVLTQMINLTGEWRKPRNDSSSDRTPHVTLITFLIKILYPSISQRPIRTTCSAQPFTFNMFIPIIFGEGLPRFATLTLLLSLPPRRQCILKHGGTNLPNSQKPLSKSEAPQGWQKGKFIRCTHKISGATVQNFSHPGFGQPF